jgi:hypothetical protein
VLHLFFESWRFPIFLLSCLALFSVALVVILLVPPSGGALFDFARAFKVWCFEYDPATGGMDWVYVALFFLGPVLMSTAVFVVWGKTLRDAFPWKFLPYSGAALILLASVATTFAMIQSDDPEPSFAFPGEILRTEIPAPEIALTNQDGDPINLADYRGRPVLLTGLYARCGNT